MIWNPLEQLKIILERRNVTLYASADMPKSYGGGDSVYDSVHMELPGRLTLYTLNQSLFAFNIRLPNGLRFLPSSESLPETGSRHLKTLSSYMTPVNQPSANE
jgi:hypothetical protein